MTAAMRAAVIALVLAAAAALGCQLERRAARPTVQDEAEILGVLERQEQAWNRGDIDAFMQGYQRSDALVFTSGGKIRRGWDATLARYRDKYVGADAMGHLELTEVVLQPVGADGVVVLGRWELTQTPEAGTGVFTVVFTRGDDGRWLIVHDHTSALVP